MTWVGERAKIEQRLKDGSAGCWLAAVEAVKECCEDFNKNYDATVSFSKDTEGVIVAITQAPMAVVTMKFDSKKPAIVVSVNNGNPRVFQICADESGVFIKSFGSGQQKLTPDEFSREALEAVLFAA